MFSARRHARRPRNPRRPPAAVLVRKTPRHPSVLSLRTCSLVRTGARGSRPRIQKRASVSLSLCFTCHRHGLRVFGFGAGEVGKLLGAKWKELEEEEKKVGSNGFGLFVFFLPALSGIHAHFLCQRGLIDWHIYALFFFLAC